VAAVDGSPTALPTSLVRVTSSTYVFKGKSPGLSVFAIGAGDLQQETPTADDDTDYSGSDDWDRSRSSNTALSATPTPTPMPTATSTRSTTPIVPDEETPKPATDSLSGEETQTAEPPEAVDTSQQDPTIEEPGGLGGVPVTIPLILVGGIIAALAILRYRNRI
jgi:hypothetical protein